MRIDLYIAVAVTTVAVSLIAFWSNPKRRTTQFFLSVSVHVGAWLLCLRFAVVGSAVDGLLWLKISSACGGLLPWHLWFIKESIVSPEKSFVSLARKSLWLAIPSSLLAVLPFTEWFIPADSTPERPIYGIGYFVYIAGVVGVYLMVCREAVVEMKGHARSKRVELQVLLLGGSATALTILLLMALRATLRLPALSGFQPLVILAFYVGTTVAMTTHRVFDARQILLVCIEKALLVSTTAVVAFSVDFLLAPLMFRSIDFLITTAAALWFAAFFSAWLDRKLNLYPEASLARHAAFAVAGKEARIEKLELAFLPILKGWAQSDHAIIISGSKGRLSGGAVDLDENSPVATTMPRIRWATPERLARERSTPERAEVAKFLEKHSLGVLVSSDGPTLKTLIGVGVPASRRPFTYPQVTQLLELAAIIEGSLERAHLSAKAQQAEQLATVGMLGAGVAHEIRNPLVSIKTFVQLLPNHYQDPAFRDKFFKLIGDEVTRIDRLTEQLLDLASPRAYEAKIIPLHPVLQAGLDLVAARAEGKSVELRRDLGATPDQALIDPAAVKQVLLNLCFNAIHAVETQVGERWVRIVTRNVPDGIEMTVSDSGPGIAPEIRALLFQPFQSTKSSGFGLGLAICRDILGNLNSVITVDPPAPGRGATFRVVFPCRPS